eukprot:TRINITY_DN6709_c0_g1_i3.p2 TRINITY_DN6709_c0_g1~~TRINITY_DN6709_c0_g1_i3.p2  ORF type:complete len:180 (-),score=60.58 TRINITY_DN6709_c0_g1_i3:11-550(-)
MIRRPPRSTQSRSSAASDVYKRQIYTSLALAMIGSCANRDLCENLKPDLIRLALEDTQRSIFVKKKALLCLLRVYRKFKDFFEPQAWGVALSTIFEHRQLGLLLAATSLLQGVVSLGGSVGFEDLVPKMIKILERLVLQNDCPQEYLYYRTPNPWLQICLLYTSPSPRDRQKSRMPSSA